MLSSGLLSTLALAAAGVGALHALAPDHWVPFAAVARARGWSAARAARVTLACGLGHVTVSSLSGLLAIGVSLHAFAAMGRRLEAIAGVLLIVFGLVYLQDVRRGAGALRRSNSPSGLLDA